VSNQGNGRYSLIHLHKKRAPETLLNREKELFYLLLLFDPEDDHVTTGMSEYSPKKQQQLTCSSCLQRVVRILFANISTIEALS